MNPLDVKPSTTPGAEGKDVDHNEKGMLEGSFEWEAVQHGLPLVGRLEHLISARMLVEHKGRRYFSYVFHEPHSDRIVKQATENLAARDAIFLQRLTSPFFPRAFSAEQQDGWSVAVIEWIEGETLQMAAREMASDLPRLAHFFRDCLDLLAQLQEHGITHRDIRADNLLVRGGRPVLIDFGWAISDDYPIWTPRGLGRDGSPAKGVFCDVFAMGKVFEKMIAKGDRTFAPLLAVMTAPDRARRLVSIPTLKLLLENCPWHADSTTNLTHRSNPEAQRATPRQNETAGRPDCGPVSATETADSLLTRANALRQQSKWREAGPIYQILTHRWPDDQSVWRASIECARKLGHRVLMNLLIQDAIRCHPEWSAEIKAASLTEGKPARTIGTPQLNLKTSTLAPDFILAASTDTSCGASQTTALD